MTINVNYSVCVKQCTNNTKFSGIASVILISSMHVRIYHCMYDAVSTVLAK